MTDASPTTTSWRHIAHLGLRTILLSAAATFCLLSLIAPNRAAPPTMSGNVVQSTTTQLSPIQLTDQVSVPAASGNYAADDHPWLLINKTHPFGDVHYRPADLAPVPVATRPSTNPEDGMMRAIVFNDLQQLFQAAQAAGHVLRVGTGYRSYQTQLGLFNQFKQRLGETRAAAISARPGHSEHQSGLAVDIALGTNLCWQQDCFSQTPGGRWLAAHAHEYGFIMRYPAGKTGVIDFEPEPWHLRYVGRDLASALHNTGQTLDEVWPALEQYQARRASQ